MKRVLILGAGGHAQVTADILMRSCDAGAAFEPIGYLDDNACLHGQARLGLPVLGFIRDFASIAHDALIIGIGDNRTRQSLFDQLQQQNICFAIARHPAAVIAPDVTIGPGAVIGAGVVVNTGSVIGANIILNTSCTVGHHNSIGSHAHIGPGVHMGGEVQIGEGAFIGIGATVMPHRLVDDWSVIGAGAVVRTNIPSHVVAVGMPARVIKSRLAATF